MSEEITTEVVESPEVADVSEEVEQSETQEETQQEEETTEESEETTEETEAEEQPEEEQEEEKGPKKLTSSERIQQLIEKNKELEAEYGTKLSEQERKIQDLESKFNETQAPEFFEVDQDKVNAYIAEQEQQITVLKEAGDYVAARAIEKSLNQLDTDLEENNRKREEAEKQRDAEQNDAAYVEKRLNKIGDAAEFYREHHNIPAATWGHMSDLFAAELDKNPLLGREFAEYAEVMPPTAVVKWAHEYTTKNLLKPVSRTVEKKEAAKNKSIGGAPGGGDTFADVKTYKDLMDLPAEKLKELHKRNPKLFDKLTT